MSLNQMAYQSGVLGALPPAPAFRSGSLGVLGFVPPVSGAVRSGSLGILGAPPPSGAVKSGVLGTLGGGPPPSGAVRSGSLGVLGEYFAQNGLGADAVVMPTAVGPKPAMATLTMAIAGLGAVAAIWWAMTRRHA